jgi:hypothetical protein
MIDEALESSEFEFLRYLHKLTDRMNAWRSFGDKHLSPEHLPAEFRVMKGPSDPPQAEYSYLVQMQDLADSFIPRDLQRTMFVVMLAEKLVSARMMAPAHKEYVLLNNVTTPLIRVLRYMERLGNLMCNFTHQFSDISVLQAQLLADERKWYEAPVNWWQRVWRSMRRRFKTDADKILEFIPTLDRNQIVNVPKSAFGAVSPIHRHLVQGPVLNGKSLVDAADASVITQQSDSSSRPPVAVRELPIKPHLKKTMEMCEVVVESDVRKEQSGSRPVVTRANHTTKNTPSLPAKSLLLHDAATMGAASLNSAIEVSTAPSVFKSKDGPSLPQASDFMTPSQACVAVAQPLTVLPPSVGSVSALNAFSARMVKTLLSRKDQHGSSPAAAPVIMISPRPEIGPAQSPVPLQTLPRSRSHSRLRGRASLTGDSADDAGRPKQETATASTFLPDLKISQAVSACVQVSPSLAIEGSIDVPEAPPRSRSRSRAQMREEVSPRPALGSHVDGVARPVDERRVAINSFLAKWGKSGASSVASPFSADSGGTASKNRVFEGVRSEIGTSVRAAYATDAQSMQRPAAAAASAPAQPEHALSDLYDEC